MNPAVIGTDVVERKVVDGVLITHRLVSSKWFFPRWAQAVSIHKKTFGNFHNENVPSTSYIVQMILCEIFES